VRKPGSGQITVDGESPKIPAELIKQKSGPKDSKKKDMEGFPKPNTDSAA
jgi:hypothetical protein